RWRVGTPRAKRRSWFAGSTVSLPNHQPYEVCDDVSVASLVLVHVEPPSLLAKKPPSGPSHCITIAYTVLLSCGETARPMRPMPCTASPSVTPVTSDHVAPASVD